MAYNTKVCLDKAENKFCCELSLSWPLKRFSKRNASSAERPESFYALLLTAGISFSPQAPAFFSPTIFSNALSCLSPHLSLAFLRFFALSFFTSSAWLAGGDGVGGIEIVQARKECTVIVALDAVGIVSHIVVIGVQNLIERCLQLYMNQKEVVDTLLYQAKIEPGFTELAKRMYFTLYKGFKAISSNSSHDVGLKKEALSKAILAQRNPDSPQEKTLNPITKQSISGLAAVNQNPSCYLSENASTSRPDGLLPNGGSSSAIISGGPAGNQNVQLGNVPSNFSGRLEVPASMLSSKNSLMGRNHMMNGTTIKTEPSYTTNSEFAFTGSSFLETQPTLDPLGASFSGPELTAQALNEPLQDIDSSPYGFLSHIPRNFSFSDLTDGFAQSAGLS
ncbi:hypothetical protein MA16_Dca016365 [Dendrobium catenatum]|uniref:Uncharacterized protein n=1 Tax=Dendrobium catenatum TaxID=906689 RepID=A0A2I0W343_9ASPA|nr:hypothetical protein MA16_Dca016365 [Dendrobium catenatum]